jgi:hypothetical protein
MTLPNHKLGIRDQFAIGRRMDYFRKLFDGFAEAALIKRIHPRIVNLSRMERLLLSPTHKNREKEKS